MSGTQTVIGLVHPISRLKKIQIFLQEKQTSQDRFRTENDERDVEKEFKNRVGSFFHPASIISLVFTPRPSFIGRQRNITEHFLAHEFPNHEPNLWVAFCREFSERAAANRARYPKV